MLAAAAEVVAALQASLALHWTAIEHYSTIAAHLSRIGYAKLGDRFTADAHEERGHARAVLDRLEFYGIQPDYRHEPPSWPRQDVPGILAASLALELKAAAVERNNTATARAANDELTALVFADLLAGSEDSVRKITADQLVIDQVGIDNWLANQT